MLTGQIVCPLFYHVMFQNPLKRDCMNGTCPYSKVWIQTISHNSMGFTLIVLWMAPYPSLGRIFQGCPRGMVEVGKGEEDQWERRRREMGGEGVKIRTCNWCLRTCGLWQKADGDIAMQMTPSYGQHSNSKDHTKLVNLAEFLFYASNCCCSFHNTGQPVSFAFPANILVNKFERIFNLRREKAAQVAETMRGTLSSRLACMSAAPAHS